MRELCIAAITAFFLCVPSVAQDATATLTGKVQDLTGAVAVPSEVELWSANPPEKAYRTRADTSGVYRLSGLPAGEYSLKLSTPGFDRLTLKSIKISEGEQRSLPPLELVIGYCGSPGAFLDHLQLLSPEGSIGDMAGSVRLDEGSKGPPLSGAIVRLMCSENVVCGSTKTNAKGEFIFRSVSPGTFAVRVNYAGFYPLEELGYKVSAGLESIYWPTLIERCPSGDCDPRRRSQKPLALCE